MVLKSGNMKEVSCSSNGCFEDVNLLNSMLRME